MPTYAIMPFLPPLVGFLPHLEQIWDARVLSSCGPHHVQFEAELCRVFKVQHVSLFGNGTLARLVALPVLEIKNAEIVTTPYSFVATTSSIIWGGNVPIFADVEADSMNIDLAKIEQAISPRAKAILAVHCHGRPCHSDMIGATARQHGLKIIYDAAHTFGIEAGDGSILNQWRRNRFCAPPDLS